MIFIIPTPVAHIAPVFHSIPCAQLIPLVQLFPVAHIAPVFHSIPCAPITDPALMIDQLVSMSSRFPPDIVAPEILEDPVVKLTKPLALTVSTYCPLYA